MSDEQTTVDLPPNFEPFSPELQQYLKYLRRVLGAIPVGVAVVDKNLVIQAFNKNAETITNMRATDALGKPYSEVMKTDSRNISDPLIEAMETGKAFVNQRFYLREDQTDNITPIRHSAAILTNEAGEMIGGVTIFADISKQVHLEQQLKSQRQLLRDILYSIPDGVATVAHDLTIQTWNDAAVKITQRTASEAISAPVVQILGQTVATMVEAALNQNHIETLTQTIDLPVADEQTCPLKITLSKINSPFEAQQEGIVLVIRDISGQLAYEQEITQQRSYFSQILDLAPYGIITINKNMVIQTFNQAAEKLIGYADSYAVGKPYKQIVQFDPEGGEDPLPNLLSNSVPQAHARLRLVDVGGRKTPIRYSASIISDAQGNLDGVIILFDDISDIVAAERTKNEFLSMVSHELRTPLTSIKGFVTAVLNGRAGEINDQQKHFLAICREQSNHLLDLINDLLDLTRLESGKLELTRERIALPDLIEHAVKTAQPLIQKKSLTIETDIASDIPPLWADKGKILQVLQNLLSNAIKFTLQAGQITVAAHNMDDNWLKLSVSDDGVGIPKEEQLRVFNPFYQVENIQIRQVGGTGLGLPIVRNIVEAHGGRIELTSEMGQGSTFDLFLPFKIQPDSHLYEPPPETAEIVSPAQTTVPKTDRPKPLILVIDDDPSTNALIEFTLESEGYDTICALNAKDAINLAEREQPDLITLDVLMPEIDGFSALDMLKKNVLTANIPVCIVSIIEDRIKGYRLGAIDYITKPFESEQLIESVENIFSEQKEKGNFQILIVEDEPAVIELVELTLNETGYEILIAQDGVSGLEKLRQHLPDLVLLDIMIPKIDGYEFIRYAKSDPRTRHVPIIVLSVRSLEEDITRALRLGAEKYLTKSPGIGDKLSDIVQEIVKESRNDTES